jgi:F420-0:gamma-glutamyl ligase
MLITEIKTRIFKFDEDILSFLQEFLPPLEEKDIVVVTSKIISLAEGRYVKKIDDIQKKQLVWEESDQVEFIEPTHLTIFEGMLMGNAGVDESNGDGHIILLPRHSFQTAEKIRQYFLDKYKLRELGVVITDSRSLPLRLGITGLALGYAGFQGLKDYRGTLDIFHRPFKFSRVNIADSLATAAILCMGEGSERQPLALIKDALVKFVDQVWADELKVDLKDDRYRALYKINK